MKRILYILLLSCVLFGGCTKEQTDSVDDGQTIHRRSVLLHSSQEDSRATYNNSLQAQWETSDQIKMVQGCATFSDNYASILDFVAYSDESSKNRATFEGDVLVSSPQNNYYHFTYPASGSLSVQDWTTTLVQTIPSLQNGKWIPYMYASTLSDEENLDNISASFTVINGALGIQLYELFDYQTPKTISSVTVSANKNIVGSYTMSATKGNPLSTGELSNASAEISASEDLLYTEGPKGSYYEYRFNAMPNDALTLNITINDGSESRNFTAEGVKIEAGKITRLRIAWQSPDIVVDEPTSWYDKIAGLEIESGSEVKSTDGTPLHGSTIYASGIHWNNIPKSAEKGIFVDGVRYPGEFSKGELTPGAHTICAYAELTSGNGTKLIKSEEKEVTVTPIVTVELGELSSWYTESAGGASSLTEGGVVNIKNGINVSDVSSMMAYIETDPYDYSYTYGSTTATQTAKVRSDDTIDITNYNGDCTVSGRVHLKNGSVIKSVSQKIPVTEKFSVTLADNALTSWFEGDDSLNGNTMYITENSISDTTSGEFSSESRYYEYRSNSSTSWVKVRLNSKNTSRTEKHLNGSKVIETTTEVSGLSNGIYHVKACSVLPNGTIIESDEQSIEVTDKFTVSLGELSSWYSLFKQNGTDSMEGGKIAISLVSTTGNGIADYITSKSIIYNGAASGSITPTLGSANTITNLSADGTYNLYGQIILTGKRNIDNNGTKKTKTIRTDTKSVIATKEVWSISMGTATSWYKEASLSSTISGNTIKVNGGITTNASTDSSLVEVGYTLDGQDIAGRSATSLTTSAGNKDYTVKAYFKIGNQYKYTAPQTLTVTEIFTASIGDPVTWYSNSSAVSSGSTIQINNGITMSPNDDKYFDSCSYSYSGASTGGTSVQKGVKISIDGLPSGEYKVKGSIKLKNGVVIISSEKETTVTKIPTVTANIKSSYNTNGSVNKKNTNWYDPSQTDYNTFRHAITFTDVSINNSDDFTTKKISSTSYYIDGNSVPNIKTDCDQGLHNCYVKCTMDNKNKNTISSAVYTIQVTGLPYQSSTDSFKNDWSKNGDWDMDGSVLRIRNNAEATFTFHVPENIDVTVDYRIEGYVSTRIHDLTTIFKAGSTTIINNTISGTGKTVEYKSVASATLTSSEKELYAKSGGKSSSMATSKVRIYRVSVLYK